MIEYIQAEYRLSHNQDTLNESYFSMQVPVTQFYQLEDNQNYLFCSILSKAYIHKASSIWVWEIYP